MIMEYSLWEWLKMLLTGTPHRRIQDGEYIDRWYIIPRNSFFNIYLHRYHGGDQFRYPHDHPWNSISIVLRGALIEENYTHIAGWNSDFSCQVEVLKPFRPKYRTAEAIHRVLLPDGGEGKTWSLFITTRKRRGWGFWIDEGKTFVPWDSTAREEFYMEQDAA